MIRKEKRSQISITNPYKRNNAGNIFTKSVKKKKKTPQI